MGRTGTAVGCRAIEEEEEEEEEEDDDDDDDDEIEGYHDKNYNNDPHCCTVHFVESL